MLNSQLLLRSKFAMAKQALAEENPFDTKPTAPAAIPNSYHAPKTISPATIPSTPAVQPTAAPSPVPPAPSPAPTALPAVSNAPRSFAVSDFQTKIHSGQPSSIRGQMNESIQEQSPNGQMAPYQSAAGRALLDRRHLSQNRPLPEASPSDNVRAYAYPGGKAYVPASTEHVGDGDDSKSSTQSFYNGLGYNALANHEMEHAHDQNFPDVPFTEIWMNHKRRIADIYKRPAVPKSLPNKSYTYDLEQHVESQDAYEKAQAEYAAAIKAEADISPTRRVFENTNGKNDEIGPSIGDLVFRSEQFAKEHGKPLEHTVRFPSGKSHDINWMRGQAKRHGYWDGQSMDSLLIDNSAGQQWLRDAAGSGQMEKQNSQPLIKGSAFRALFKQAIDVQQVYSKNKPSYYLPEHLRANPMNLAEATNLANGMAAVAPHNALDNTRLDLNGLQVQGYGSRVQNNKRLTSLGRWHHQFAGDELEGALPDRTQGLGDLYMPFSDVVSVPSGNAGTAMHELGHAIDFNAFPHDSSLRRGIAAIYRNRAPTLWTEHAAWRKGQNAVRDAAAQDKLELQMAHKALSEGASAKRVGLGSYWGGAVGGAAGAGVGLAGSIGLMLAMENQGMRARGLGRLVPMAAIGGGVLGAMGGTALGAYMGRNPVDPDKITWQLARAIAKKRGISPNEAVDLVHAALAAQKFKKPAKQPARKSDKQFALKQALFDDKPLGLDNPATNVPPPSTQPATQPAPQPMQQNTLANMFANMVNKNNQPKSPPAQSLPSAPASAPSTPTPAAAGGAPSAGNAWHGAQAPPKPAAPTQSAPAKPAVTSPPNDIDGGNMEWYGNTRRQVGDIHNIYPRLGPANQRALNSAFRQLNPRKAEDRALIRNPAELERMRDPELNAPLAAALKQVDATRTSMKQEPSFEKEYANAMGNNARNVLGAVNTAHSYLPIGTVVGNGLNALTSGTASLGSRLALLPANIGNTSSELLPPADKPTFSSQMYKMLHDRAVTARPDTANYLDRALHPYAEKSQKPYVPLESAVQAEQAKLDGNPYTRAAGSAADTGGRMLMQVAAMPAGVGAVKGTGTAAKELMGLAPKALSVGGIAPAATSAESAAANAANAAAVRNTLRTSGMPSSPTTSTYGSVTPMSNTMAPAVAAAKPLSTTAKVLGGASIVNGVADGYQASEAIKRYNDGDETALDVGQMPPIPEEAANNLIAAKPSEHMGLAQAAAAPIIEGGPEAIQSATRGMQDTAKGVMGNPETAKAVTESVTTGKLAPNLFDTGWQSLTEMTQDPQKAVDMFKNMSFPEQLGLAVGLGMAGLGLLAYFGSEEGGLGGALMALLGLGVAGGIGANALTGGVVGNEIANSTLGKAIGGSELGKAIGGMFSGAAPPVAPPVAPPAPAPAPAPAQGMGSVMSQVGSRMLGGVKQVLGGGVPRAAPASAKPGAPAVTPAGKQPAAPVVPFAANLPAPQVLDSLQALPAFKDKTMQDTIKLRAPQYDPTKPNSMVTFRIREALRGLGVTTDSQADAVVAEYRRRNKI